MGNRRLATDFVGTSVFQMEFPAYEMESNEIDATKQRISIRGRGKTSTEPHSPAGKPFEKCMISFD